MAEDWLQDLKPGDEVAVTNSRSFSRYVKFARVERLTPTQIIVSGQRFARRSGREVGQGYGRDFLTQATAELKAEIAQERRRNELLLRLRDTRWRDMPDEVLERVVSVLDESVKASST